MRASYTRGRGVARTDVCRIPVPARFSTIRAAGSASADLALTMTAVLTNPDQFTFQDDGESGTLPSASTLVASKADASATGAATLDTTAALSGDDQSTAAATADGSADTGLTSNVATNLQPAIADSTSTSYPNWRDDPRRPPHPPPRPGSPRAILSCSPPISAMSPSRISIPRPL